MAELRIQPGQIALTQAVNAKQRWTTRKSLRVELVFGRLRGTGEVAPLPGFSQESEQEVAHAVQRLQNTHQLRELTKETFESVSAAHLPHWENESPSVQFALQSAWLDALGQSRSVPVCQLLRQWLPSPSPGPLRVPSAARLLGLAESLEQSPNGVPAACSIKIKIGPAESFDRQLDPLNSVRDNWHGALRLDANGSLGADWEKTLERCAALKPEFVEEPCDPQQLGPPRSLPCPIAFDESLSTLPRETLEHWLCSGSVGALVLKPMLLGNLHSVRDLVSLGKSYQVPCVISHLFDGGAAMASYRHIAAAWGTPGVCSGLGTHDGLALWPLNNWSLSAPGLGLRDHD